MSILVKSKYLLFAVLMLGMGHSSFCAQGDPPKSKTKALVDRLGKPQAIVLKKDTLVIKHNGLFQHITARRWLGALVFSR